VKKQLVILLALSFFLSCQHSITAPPAPSASQKEENQLNPDNYCHDQKSWAKWDHLVKKYPNDSNLQTLHALRIGLCIKIDQGSILLEDAIDIFNHAHDAVIEKARQESEGKKPSM
jgi:hypothetical protein